MLFGDRELISITGSGGKTSLMLALGSWLSLRYRVVLTTTTRLGEDQIQGGMKFLVGTLDEVMAELPACLVSPGCVAIARGVEKEKLVGFAPSEVDILHESGLADVIIVEADGSKGFPVKGYADHEPVVPSRTTCRIVMVGAEIFSEPLDERTVFRLPQFLSASGLEKGAKPRPAEIASVLENPRIFLKDGAKRDGMQLVLFVNKMDLLLGTGREKMVEETLERLTRYDMACTGVLRWGEYGRSGFGGGEIPADGNEQAASAFWEGNCPFHCLKLGS